MLKNNLISDLSVLISDDSLSINEIFGQAYSNKGHWVLNPLLFCILFTLKSKCYLTSHSEHYTFRMLWLVNLYSHTYCKAV